MLAQAGIAHAALERGADKDAAFYRGKVATASFFAKNMLPRLTALRHVLDSIDDDIMRISEQAF